MRRKATLAITLAAAMAATAVPAMADDKVSITIFRASLKRWQKSMLRIMESILRFTTQMIQ